MDNLGYTSSEGGQLEQVGKQPEASSPEVKSEARRIYQNVVLISTAFLLLFVAFESMSKLQSSINTLENLGLWSSVAVYLSLILSCLFLPSILISSLSVKWTMVVCVFSYSSYIAAQFSPQFWTLLPTGVLVGLGAAPLWSAKCSYLTQAANRLALLEEAKPETVLAKFFGIFFFFFQCNSILGNIISSVVLSPGNSSFTGLTDSQMLHCGSSYCPEFVEIATNVTEAGGMNNNNFKTDINKIYTMAGIYLACSVSAGLLIAIFVDPIKTFLPGHEEEGEGEGCWLLVATVRQLKDKRQLLLVPITFWSGVEQGFFGADFTAGFVTCAYGVHVVGRVLILYGVCNALASISFGFVRKFIGRLPVLLLGAALNLSVIVSLLAWTPSSSTQAVVYILAALWAVADAIWQTQINALYGCLFTSNEKAAFSNYKLWESSGFLFAFITSATGVCILPKIVSMVVFLLLGMAAYLILEYGQVKSKNVPKL